MMRTKRGAVMSNACKCSFQATASLKCAGPSVNDAIVAAANSYFFQ